MVAARCLGDALFESVKTPHVTSMRPTAIRLSAIWSFSLCVQSTMVIPPLVHHHERVSKLDGKVTIIEQRALPLLCEYLPA